MLTFSASYRGSASTATNSNFLAAPNSHRREGSGGSNASTIKGSKTPRGNANVALNLDRLFAQLPIDVLSITQRHHRAETVEETKQQLERELKSLKPNRSQYFAILGQLAFDFNCDKSLDMFQKFAAINNKKAWAVLEDQFQENNVRAIKVVRALAESSHKRANDLLYPENPDEEV